MIQISGVNLIHENTLLISKMPTTTMLFLEVRVTPAYFTGTSSAGAFAYIGRMSIRHEETDDIPAIYYTFLSKLFSADSALYVFIPEQSGTGVSSSAASAL